VLLLLIEDHQLELPNLMGHIAIAAALN